MSNVEKALSRIPSREEIRQSGLAVQVAQVLDLLADEFCDDNGALDIMLKAVDKGTAWQWFAELPFQVDDTIAHAVKDELVEKGFNQIYFNPYGSFTSGVTRMSVTINKGE